MDFNCKIYNQKNKTNIIGSFSIFIYYIGTSTIHCKYKSNISSETRKMQTDFFSDYRLTKYIHPYMCMCVCVFTFLL